MTHDEKMDYSLCSSKESVGIVAKLAINRNIKQDKDEKNNVVLQVLQKAWSRETKLFQIDEEEFW